MRRKGLATSLVAELEQRSVTRGALRINLLVLPNNSDGLHFWQRLGYVLCTKPIRARPSRGALRQSDR